MRRSLFQIFFGTSFLVLAGVTSIGYADTVYACRPKKSDPMVLRCAVRGETGIVGDTARVLDEQARVVATGRVVKREGMYVALDIRRDSVAKKGIRRGYPVVVDLGARQQSMRWAASFDSE